MPPLAGERIQEANGHVETSRYLGFGVGPALGGLLCSRSAGSSWPMIVDAATFAAVAVAALALRVRREAERGWTPRRRSGPATASPTSSATGSCRW